jgi:hypothetical protein
MSLLLHYAVVLPIILAENVAATGAPATGLRIGAAVQIVHDVAGRQSNDQTLGSKAEVDDVYENEYTGTAVESQARFLLVNRTALSVRPITTIRIDRVVYNPYQSIKGVVVSAGQGPLRRTSGNSCAYLITTPTANVTPMGTVVDLFVDSQRTFVILRQGRIRGGTISLQQTRKTLVESGEMMLATADDARTGAWRPFTGGLCERMSERGGSVLRDEPKVQPASSFAARSACLQDQQQTCRCSTEPTAAWSKGTETSAGDRRTTEPARRSFASRLHSQSLSS